MSGAQLRLVVALKMAAVTIEIERQHTQAVRQARVQTQMRTRQELIQKVASMRRSKKKRRDYGESTGIARTRHPPLLFARFLVRFLLFFSPSQIFPAGAALCSSHKPLYAAAIRWRSYGPS